LFLQGDVLGLARLELLPETKDRFFVLAKDLTITFLSKDDGAVDEATVQYYGTRSAIRQK